MLDQFKRWFSSSQLGFDLDAMSEWSRLHGSDFKRVREGEGFALDGTWSGRPWRLEWGPSQRSYIQDRELRLRIELNLPPDLQMLVLNRCLAESLEASAFDQYTQTTQTVIDTSAPEEMRWLAMFPKVSLSAHKALRGRYGAWSNAPSVAQWWIEGPLAHDLELLAGEGLPEDIPFVLMTLRGRLYLRAQITTPSQELLTHLHSVFLTAAEQALRVSTLERGDGSLAGELDAPSTQPGSWAHRSSKTV